MSEQKRAAIYARSATYPDDGARFPIVEQIHLCHEYAIKEGYEIVEELQEVGSGMIIGPVLKSLAETAKEGKFDALLICTFDRLSRNHTKAFVVNDTLEEFGVKVIVVTDPDINTPIQKFYALLREEVAKIEREKIAQRSLAGKRAKRLDQEGK